MKHRILIKPVTILFVTFAFLIVYPRTVSLENIKTSGKYIHFDVNNRIHLDYSNHSILYQYKKEASKESLGRVGIYKNFNMSIHMDIIGLQHARLDNSMINVSVLEDVFLSIHISTYEGFITTSYIPRPDMQGPYPFIFQQCIGHYNIGVYVIQWWHHFGHLIHDFLSALVFLPKELYDTDFVVAVPPTGRKSAELWLKAFNFSRNMQLIDINNNNKVHVNKLYVITSGQFAHGYTIAGIAKVRSCLFDYYNLNKIVPTEYKIINRPSGNRMIYGIDELLIELAKYKNLEEGQKWTIDKYNSDNMSDVIRAFSSIKVLITPQGSGVYNCIFMQPKTGILLFSSKDIDGPNCQFAAAGDYFMVSVVHWDMGVYDQGKKCDAKAIAKMANFLVESVRKGKLKNDPDFIELFPIFIKMNGYKYTNVSPDLI